MREYSELDLAEPAKVLPPLDGVAKMKGPLGRSLVYFTSLLLFIPSSFAQAQDFTILPIARFGDPAPDFDLFDRVHTLSFNDSGQIAFGALTGVSEGIFLFDQGELRTIVRQGDPAPGGGNFALFGYTWLNEQGQVAFSVILQTGEEGLYLFNKGEIRAIARSGDAAPGCGTFGSLVLPWLNNQGQVAFIGRVSGHYSTFLYDGDQVLTIACAGDPAPGGGTFLSTLQPSLNDSGQVVFEGQVSSPNTAGIFLYEEGQLRQIVRSDDPAPRGETFSSLYVPVINASGQVVFVASLRSTPQTWVPFLYDQGGIRRLLPFDDPGTEEEVGLAPPSGGRQHPLYFNDLSETAFVGGRRFPGEERFRGGLFHFDRERFNTVLFLGDPMPDPRGYTFSSVLKVCLNNLGEIAFVAGGYPRVGASGLFLAIPNK
jgi:hypothetical protein